MQVDTVNLRVFAVLLGGGKSRSVFSLDPIWGITFLLKICNFETTYFFAQKIAVLDRLMHLKEVRRNGHLCRKNINSWRKAVIYFGLEQPLTLRGVLPEQKRCKAWRLNGWRVGVLLHESILEVVSPMTLHFVHVIRYCRLQLLFLMTV